MSLLVGNLAFIFGSMALSFLAALGWRELALRHGWVDWPDARRLHAVPTPRGGGIGIAVVVLLALCMAPQRMPAIIAGIAVVAAGGLIDDLRPLPALPKLGFQVLGAALIAAAAPLPALPFAAVGGAIGAAVVVLALVNAWNFMDGSNGLASSQGAVVGFALALCVAQATEPGEWAFAVVAIGWALLCGGIGFLPLNLGKARVFLGDVGSQAIGASVAAGLLLLSAHGDAADRWALALPPSAFLIDAGMTLAGRLRRRERVWEGHRLHLYQRAIAAGCSHGRVCAIYGLWTVAACLLAVWLQASGSGDGPLAVAAVYTAGMLLYVALGRRWPRPAPGRE